MPTLAEVRARVETDLDDATLQTILDAENDALIDHAGNDSETETQFASGLRKIVLRRKPVEIIKITERRQQTSDPVELTEDDWRKVGSYGLVRVFDGTNPAGCWGAEVVVEYAPRMDLKLRERVLLDLVQLSVEFRGMESEEIGDYRQTQRDYATRRQALLDQVREGRALIA